MKQALQRPGDRPSYETHYSRGISKDTTSRRAQSYKGTATIPSQCKTSSLIRYEQRDEYTKGIHMLIKD